MKLARSGDGEVIRAEHTRYLEKSAKKCKKKCKKMQKVLHI